MSSGGILVAMIVLSKPGDKRSKSLCANVRCEVAEYVSRVGVWNCNCRSVVAEWLGGTTRVV